jgi:hypothetical protein
MGGGVYAPKTAICVHEASLQPVSTLLFSSNQEWLNHPESPPSAPLDGGLMEVGGAYCG